MFEHINHNSKVILMTNVCDLLLLILKSHFYLYILRKFLLSH